MEIQEIIRRWRSRKVPRQIADGAELSRNAVRKYLVAARAEGIAQRRTGAQRGSGEPIW